MTGRQWLYPVNTYRAEVVRIQGKSYRQKEADEREAARKAERGAKQAAPRGRRATP